MLMFLQSKFRFGFILACLSILPVYAKNQANPSLFTDNPELLVKKGPSQSFVWSNKDENLSSQHKYLLALNYEKQKNKQKLALKYLTDSAKMGYAQAQYYLGMKYYQGEMVAKKLSQANQWLSKAAAQEHPKAMFQLALMTQKGEGVRPSSRKTYQLLENASENGSGEAQHALAVLYLKDGKAQNIERAVFWLRKAVAQSNPDAKRDLGFLYMDGVGVEQDYQHAIKLLTEPAQQGNPMSQYLLGEIYANGGYGINRQPQKAHHWYRLALQSGYPDAKAGIQKLRGKTRSYAVAPGVEKATNNFNRNLIYAWKQAWQSKNFQRYRSFYSRYFRNQNNNYQSWIKYRQKVIAKSNNIHIEISHLTVVPQKNSRVLVKFHQKYQSESYSDKVIKKQYWRQDRDSQWRIVYEDSIQQL